MSSFIQSSLSISKRGHCQYSKFTGREIKTPKLDNIGGKWQSQILEQAAEPSRNSSYISLLMSGGVNAKGCDSKKIVKNKLSGWQCIGNLTQYQ